MPIAASQASHRLSAAALPRRALQQLLFPTSAPLLYCASTTICVAGRQTDSAEKQPRSKIQFPNVIYCEVAGTAVQAQRKKQSEGGKKQPWV